jgi:hypothetical protein
MELTRIARACGSGDACPAGFTTDRGTAVIQGATLTAHDLPANITLPDGESAVEIPLALLEEMARALRS